MLRPSLSQEYGSRWPSLNLQLKTAPWMRRHPSTLAQDYTSLLQKFSPVYSCAPPATYTTFTSLKTHLILKYGLTQTKKDAPLLTISELGDRKPSALLRCMNSLVSFEDGSSSLSINMPQSVRVAAAEVSPKDIADSTADDLLAPHMSSSTINQQAPSPLAPTTTLCWTMSQSVQFISIEHDDTVSMEQLTPHLRQWFSKSASSLGGAMWRTPNLCREDFTHILRLSDSISNQYPICTDFSHLSFTFWSVNCLCKSLLIKVPQFLYLVLTYILLHMSIVVAIHGWSLQTFSIPKSSSDNFKMTIRM